MDLYDGPIRGGTRGGAAEFKWTDVGGDKDRENYLGHSINAPTGRWQKNQDVHWYTRDGKDSDLARAEEIRRIKAAEADILAIQLGFKAPPKPGEVPNVPVTAIPLPPDQDVPADIVENAVKRVEREDKARRKEEKRARKEAKQTRKDDKRERKEQRRAHREERGSHRERSHSRSPEPRRRDRSRSRSPRRDRPLNAGDSGADHDRRPARRDQDDHPRRSRSPPRIRPGDRTPPYHGRSRDEPSNSRDADRRRW